MIAPPINLHEDYWFVYSKPDGVRCLITTGEQRTIARDKNGFFLKSFKTMLPGGCHKSDSKKLCTLDCIFDQRSQVFYIMDVLIWEGTPVMNNSAESRFFCIDASILADKRVRVVDQNNEFAFSTVQRYDCNEKGFRTVYTEDTPYLKDGVYFFHKEAEYYQGLNPYLYWWKDQFISLYQFGDRALNEDPTKFYAVLELNNKNKLVTLDDYEICPMPAELKKQENYFTGNLIYISIGKITLNQTAENLREYFNFEEIEILKRANFKRAVSDSLSKIVAQYVTKNCPISAENLVEIIKKANEEQVHNFDQ